MFIKNQANDLPFVLVDVNGWALTGATVSGYVTLDQKSQKAVVGSIVEQGRGQYLFKGAAADWNGNTVGLLFTATDAIPVHFTVKTETVTLNELQTPKNIVHDSTKIVRG